MLDDLSYLQDPDDDPMLEHLVQATQQLNRQINDCIQDDTIIWGNIPTIQDLSESDCVSNCRMRKMSLQIFADKMWPKFSAILGNDKYRIQCKNRYTIHYESGLIILLYRYSLPRRLCPDMEKIFGIRKSRLSAIIQSFSEALYEISIPYLTNPTIWHHRMPYYSQLISNKTRGIANNIWGFIDGTIRKTCRPIYHQRVVYTRFKKCHGLKFQSMLVPDGFIACLYGPVPAKTHDARLLRESQLVEQLQTVMPEDGTNQVFALYGDLAYAQNAYVLGGFRNVVPNSDEAAYNRLLSSVCITVEWGFAELVEQWKFLDFRSAMKIFQCPVAQYYINAAFLSNIRNCLLGNKTQQYFNAQQLTIDEYLGLVGTHSVVDDDMETEDST